VGKKCDDEDEYPTEPEIGSGEEVGAVESNRLVKMSFPMSRLARNPLVSKCVAD
jgi:hypothetical protein